MIRAKNYETVSKFVKVMTKILWPLFLPDTVYLSYNLLYNKSHSKLKWVCAICAMLQGRLFQYPLKVSIQLLISDQ